MAAWRFSTVLAVGRVSLDVCAALDTDTELSCSREVAVADAATAPTALWPEALAPADRGALRFLKLTREAGGYAGSATSAGSPIERGAATFGLPAPPPLATLPRATPSANPTITTNAPTLPPAEVPSRLI